VSSYAEGRAEALPWGLVLVEGIVVALLGLILLLAPGASLFFLERVMNSIRNGLGMQETEIAREPS
jgi:uncharacterized membrane protein HdeD (DUF308 family)